MPLIRSRHQMGEGLVGIELKGDKQIFHHAQNVLPLMEECHNIRKNLPDTRLKKRSGMKLIARIPELAYYSNPEIHAPGGGINPDGLFRFLDSPQGELFKTVNGSARHA